MAMTKTCLYFLGLFCLFACSTNATRIRQDQGGRWCVAKTAVPNDKLQGFIDFCCGQLDCAQIRPGGSCFQPNTLQNHASYALDLYFRKKGVCNFEIGTPAVTDPSFGNCHYP